jgi:hypothetical protein
MGGGEWGGCLRSDDGGCNDDDEKLGHQPSSRECFVCVRTYLALLRRETFDAATHRA